MEPRLPSDADILLARLLKDGMPEQDRDQGPVLEALQDYRDAFEAHAEHPDSDRMWSAIAAETTAKARPASSRRRQSVSPIRFTRLRRVWMPVAIAATLALLIGLPFLFPGAPAERLLAEAGTEQTVYTAADGSTVTLRPGSRLYGTGDADHRLEGEGFFDVARDPSRTFTVATEQGLVAVLGTKFNVQSLGGQTTVFLVSGSVRFSATGDGTEVVLEPGQSVMASGSGLMSGRSESEDEATDWMRGELVFDARPADVIAQELGAHFGVRLRLPDTISGETLSGRILLRDAEQALGDIGIVLGGRFVATGDSSYDLQMN